MTNFIYIDGITMVVFVIFVIALGVGTIIAAIGWLYESGQRAKAEDRLRAHLEDECIAALCDSHKKGYDDYMDKLTARHLKENK